ncbi:MAG: glycoside hydrolase family 97 catalytic domain-containing protein [Saprospiraceae bacterium]|nr:glycoside hydrolase family 97 catalytic domain-containing protein [Saprospiraceae bacterium]
MKHFLLLILLASAFTHCSQPNSTFLNSPDGRFKISITPDHESRSLFYEVYFEGRKIVDKSGLGLQVGESQETLKIESVIYGHRTSVDTLWHPIYGERSIYPDRFEQMEIECFTSNETFAKLSILVRAYDEGVAFRYQATNNDSVEIIRELTEFKLPVGTDIWSSTRAQGPINKLAIGDLDEAMERPLLAQLDDSLFLAIGEAALVDFARMKLILKDASSPTLSVELGSEVAFNGPFQGPWRFIMAGKSAGAILENNYLILNLNNSSDFSDTDWIKPGKVIREVTLTTQGGLACVDFAARHNLQFVEFDAGWYGPEYDEQSDATMVSVDPERSKGPLDLQKVVTYAESKNIGIILYVNRRALEKQLDQILPLYQAWGIKGIKYGFVNVGSQKWTTWLHEAVAKAADHQLMIDIHDEYRPTGVSRTYPNLMTQEGVRGDEESPTNAMVLNTLFTRMIAGAADHTNCYFAERVDEKMGSHASQMAKAICIYSPWQFVFWYDRPVGSPSKMGGAGQNQNFISEIPELSFYDQIPTVWDDSRVMSGYPGEYAVIARQSGTTWFLGALNGENLRSFSIPLHFLDEDASYEMILYEDVPQDSYDLNIKLDTMEVNSQSLIEKVIDSQSGFAAIIQRL